MMLIPLVTFGLLLLGAVLSGLFVWQRRAFVWATAVGTTGLALVSWLAVWPSLPVAVLPVNAAWRLPMAWQIDTLNWTVVLVALIVGFVIMLVWQEDSLEAGLSSRLVLVVGALASLMVALGADSLPAMMMGWTMVAVVWSLTFIFVLKQDVIQLMPRLFYFVISLCLLWLASSWVGTIVGWDVAIWPRPAVVAGLLAGAIQVGVWPFFGWRLRKQTADPLAIFWLNLLPALLGMMLLIRLAAISEVGFVAGLLTAVALIHVLWGLYLFGSLDTQGQLRGLSATAVALPILVALWTSPQPALMEVRGYVLALTILALSSLRPIRRAQWWRLLPIFSALATIAGLPLTATFIGRAALYTAWLDKGHIVLAIVLALLQVVLVTAVLIFIKNRQAPTSSEVSERMGWLYDGALFLPMIGLFAIPTGAWTDINWLTWVLVLLPMLFGLALFYFVGRKGVPTMPQTVKAAFAINLPLRDGEHVGRELVKGVATAVGEALAILEGETGLLWLVAIVLIIVLIS